MKPFDDVRLKAKKKKAPLVVDESYDPKRSGPSPHVVDLNGRPRLRHQQTKSVKDVVFELKEDLKAEGKKKIYEEKYDPGVKIASKWSEAARMMALGLAVVFTLNGVGVFYEGMDLKDEIATAAYSSYETIKEQGLSKDTFQNAESNFEDAQKSLWFLQNQREELLSQNRTASAISNLLYAGEELSQAGASFVAFVESMREITGDLLSEKNDSSQSSITEQIITAHDTDFNAAFAKLTSANEKVQSVDAAVFPVDMQDSVLIAQSQLAELVGVLGKFDELFPIFMRLLGDEHPQRYLVLLENENEPRPGGGFMGSIVIVDINDGYLDGMEFKDIYEIDGQYFEDIEPPGEIADLTDNWRLRDSNYSPDMSVSAMKAAWFLEEEGGPGVDHVITMDLELVSRLLEITGPIKLESLPAELDSENFTTVISYIVESKLSGLENPKEILGEFIEAVQGKVREQGPWLEIGQLMQEMALTKHFSAYSKTESAQQFFEDFGVAGVLPTVVPREDYFMLVHTSIGGNKTDPYMERIIEHQTYIERDGLVFNQVKLTQKHTWGEEEEHRITELLNSFGFNEIEGWVMNILGADVNTSGMRFYVPHGTRLVSTKGIDANEISLEYDEDLELDYFYFTTTIYPGTEETLTLTYEIPFTLDFEPLDEYRLNVFKQPGDKNTIFKKIISADSYLVHYRSFPETITEDPDQYNLFSYESELTQDLHLAQLWGE